MRHHRKQTSKHQRKQKRRRRRSKVLLGLLLGTLFLLLVLGAIALWAFTNTSRTSGKAAEIKDLIINVVEKDVRTVKNTATEEHHKTNGLAICMYHYVYDKDNPPDKINSNYIEVDALEEELKYLVENDYYFPTWREVRKYIDGDLLLPEKSVVLSFDDGSKNFLELGVPLFEKYKIPVTSFLITKNNGEEKVAKYASDYVTFQSHSHDMHRSGGTIGHGGIFTALSVEEAVDDLKTSTKICKNDDAFAYPYGDYSDSCIEAVSKAGFLCAVTTKYGRAYPGDNPHLLPRIRMSHGQSLEEFIYMIE